MYRLVIETCCLLGLVFTLGISYQSLAQVTTGSSGVLIRSLPSVAPYEKDLTQIQELVRMGQHTQALERIDQLLKQAPNLAEAHFLKGVALAERGQVKQAITTFKDLTILYPFLPEPYNNLAVLYARQQEYDKARETLLQAIETHDSYATAYQNLSHIYAMMAGAAYDKALGLNASEKKQPDLQLLSGLDSAAFFHMDETPVPSAGIPISRADQASMTDEKTLQISPNDGAQKTTEATESLQQPVVALEAPMGDAQQTAIVTLIETWRSAWSSQSTTAYLQCYSSNFKLPAPFKTRSAWEKSRRGIITRPAFIEVVVQNLKISIENNNRALATFQQVYQSDRFQDQVLKTLTLQKVGAAWRIVQETSVEM